ncbi:unnamed protein product [Nezara viridula]|uniref:SCP domain-containing protein n=1 Tax=Nezara viridula TaxID=85310 RepID=A0A9P0MU58_NEZVI|nr:unnamed protein product [Nezara viridula]
MCKCLDGKQRLEYRRMEGRYPYLASSTLSSGGYVMHIFLFLAFALADASAECLNGRVIMSGHLNCTQKQLIVDTHNEMRQKVAAGKVPTQPVAADMVELRWSEVLSRKAQQWADGCVFIHDPDLMLGGEHIGQNLAQESSSKDVLSVPDLVGMMNSWFSEVYKFGYNGTFTFDSGHYSQVIWGSTKYVGCGIIYYFKANEYYSYFVCDYLPPGNWIGLKPYVYGPRDCEAHHLANSKRFPNLCAIDNSTVRVPCPEGNV